MRDQQNNEQRSPPARDSRADRKSRERKPLRDDTHDDTLDDGDADNPQICRGTD